MKRFQRKWVILALVLVMVLVGGMRLLSARKSAPQNAAAPKAETVLELAAVDLTRAATRELVQGLPVSGTLKAVNSAIVKARVAGELQDLAVREGDPVKAGQVIARVDVTEYRARLMQAQQQAESAKAQLDIAQRNWDNNKALMDQGFISKTALDTSKNNLVAAEANHKAALAAVQVAGKTVEDTLLRAPVSGIVSQRLAQPGERVGVDAKVVEIVDLRKIELEAALSPADSVSVRVGQRATLQVEGSSQPIAAKVTRINPSAQAGSRSVLAYLSVVDTPGLRQGLFAEGTLSLGRLTALAVPLSAVRLDKPAPYVQAVENERVVHKPVQTSGRGAADKETWVAVSGLEPGTVVIQGHVGPLREGTQVKFAQAAASGAAAAKAAP